MNHVDARRGHHRAELPVVSVVMPVYNHEAYVEQAIRSVIDQDYPNIEMIVIDDGSSDGSFEVVQRLAAECEQRFVRFECRTRPNKGVSATLSEGLAWTEGKYYAPISSDDAWVNGRLSLQVPFMEGRDNVVAASGYFKLMDSEGQPLTSVRQRRPRWREYSFEDFLKMRYYAPSLSTIYRLDTVREVGGYDASYKIEDYDLYLRLTEFGHKVVVLPQVLSLYRLHGENTHKRVGYMHQERRRIIDRYSSHPEYGKAVAAHSCVSFRDFAEVDKRAAVSLIPACITRFYDLRFVHGLGLLLFRRSGN